ncbi:DKNYY domain-containing protein [Achromobacter pestifer]|uniref:DKNYY domain-containing protein n=1 Tax=Achromobacter pestifer TaxID=1353889 RepID=A0A6S6YUP6_9BURK|nr:DKNYY domain-containing protein [Achromobacter pestifer]CAB3646579.1 hypothetical protein LMG3431_02490 [Achromobacter pestifer]
MMQKRTRWILSALVILIAMSPMSLLFLALADDDANALADAGQSYSGTIYKRNADRIYAAVPSNGSYPMPGADLATFEPIGEDYANRQVAKDRQHVYCGNQILPGLNPASVRTVGNSYYTDGTAAFYCAPYTVINKELGGLQEVWQKFQYQRNAGPKPQTYLYPYVALPASAQPYRSLLDRDLATDGASVFYQGLPMPQANSDTMRRLRGGRDGADRLSEDFFADGRHVYFHDQLLALSDAPALHTFRVGDLYQQPYLYDGRDGMVYVGARAFDAAHAPYRLLSPRSEHVKQALFAGKDGIYFFNSQKDRVERAGDDPFASGRFTALSPFVFSDGKQVLILQGRESWGSSRGGGGLIYRATQINRVKGAPTGEWKKLGDVYHRFGSVWQNGDQLYYFDQTGSSQLVFSPIYRILDRGAADFLLGSQQTLQIRMDDIRKLIRDGKMAAPASETILEAKTRYRGFLSLF